MNLLYKTIMHICGRTIGCLLAAMAWLSAGASAADNFVASRLTVEQGLPSNNVNDILQDDDGYVWMATDNGLCRYDGGTFINFSAARDTSGVGFTDNRLVSLSIDRRRQKLFVRSFSGACSCFSLAKGRFISCTPADAKLAQPRTPHWKASQKRSSYICVVDPRGRQITHAIPQDGNPAASRRKLRAAETRDGRSLYISLGEKVYRTDSGGDSLRELKGISPLLPPMSTISGIMVDHSGSVWICSRFCGVTKISRQAISAEHLLPNPGVADLESNDVRLVVPGSRGGVLISTKDCQLMTYTPSANGFSGRTSLAANAYAYMKDSRGRVWIGTKGNGFYVDGRHYSHKEHNIPIDNSDIYDFAEDGKGRVWIASYGGGLLLAETKADGTLHFTPFLHGTFRQGRVRKVAIDRNQRLWACTNNGLYIIDTRLSSVSESRFLSYNTANSSLPGLDIMSVMFDKRGKVWVATYGGGIAHSPVPTDYTRIRFTLPSKADGLPGNIRSIVEDKHGYIWLGTDNGLARLSPSTMHVSDYKLSDNMLANNFSDNAVAELPDGDLLFGTSYGLWRIAVPTGEGDKGSVMPTVTSLSVNGEQLYGGEGWQKAMHGKAPLPFSHEQNAIVFHFSNFNYSDNPRYRFYLAPLERTWRDATTGVSAAYDHLKPGAYTFHVQACDNTGHWSSTRTVRICISEPWYNTWWMWTVYAVAALCVVLVIVRMLLGNLRLRNSMRVEKRMMEFRIDFFTHIAHEFRTPIAIIRSAIDAMGRAGDRGQREQLGHSMRAARRGASRLSRLVDNLLLFRKINEGHARLSVSRGDVIAHLRRIYTDFFPYADSRGVKLQMLFPEQKETDMLFDHEKVEIIFSNLLSNAIKYAPERSSVVIRVKTNDGLLTVSVADEGAGIAPERLPSLFKPFMQGLASSGGMGIGLYLAHALAESHHGTLAYSPNEEAGHGAVFTFTLPLADGAYAPDEVVQAVKRDEDTGTEPADEASAALLPDVCADPINGQVTVYLVEDDADMMSQLRTELSVYFNVVAFSNGKDALAAIGSGGDKPRIVISDVMMPQTDGFELAQAIKKNEPTARIGVILLSALGTEENRMRAVAAGADDFFVKPCPMQMLITRCFRLLQNQLSFAEAQPVASDGGASLVENVVDKRFKEKVEAIIAAHLSDAYFTVDQLADQLGWGRSVVYRRVKQLFGTTPNDYIRKMRMERASELIVEGGHTVAEISLMVGFNDPAYFNRCFKKQFGTTPAKYGR